MGKLRAWGLAALTGGVVLAGGTGNPALASTIHDESLAGDLSSAAASPTPLVFSAGSNLVLGSVQASGDTRDYLSFALGQDQRLTGLFLVSYTGATADVTGNRGYHAINAGATSFVPGPGNSSAFLGGDHVDAVDVGTDLLPGLAAATLAGTGFATPLGPGTYSYLIQQTGPDFTRYALDFRVTVVPLPPAVGLFIAALVGLSGLRRRAA